MFIFKLLFFICTRRLQYEQKFLTIVKSLIFHKFNIFRRLLNFCLKSIFWREKSVVASPDENTFFTPPAFYFENSVFLLFIRPLHRQMQNRPLISKFLDHHLSSLSSWQRWENWNWDFCTTLLLLTIENNAKLPEHTFKLLWQKYKIWFSWFRRQTKTLGCDVI